MLHEQVQEAPIIEAKRFLKHFKALANKYDLTFDANAVLSDSFISPVKMHMVFYNGEVRPRGGDRLEKNRLVALSSRVRAFTIQLSNDLSSLIKTGRCIYAGTHQICHDEILDWMQRSYKMYDGRIFWRISVKDDATKLTTLGLSVRMVRCKGLSEKLTATRAYVLTSIDKAVAKKLAALVVNTNRTASFNAQPMEYKKTAAALIQMVHPTQEFIDLSEWDAHISVSIGKHNNKFSVVRSSEVINIFDTHFLQTHENGKKQQDFAK